MRPNSSSPLDLTMAFNTQQAYSSSSVPSYANLLQLSQSSDSPLALEPSPVVLYPQLALRLCSMQADAVVADIATNEPACAALVSALLPPAGASDTVPASLQYAKSSAPCTAGCVSKVRSVLGTGLAACSALWAQVPVAPSDINATGSVPLLLNSSNLVQATCPSPNWPLASCMTLCLRAILRQKKLLINLLVPQQTILCLISVLPQKGFFNHIQLL